MSAILRQGSGSHRISIVVDSGRFLPACLPASIFLSLFFCLTDHNWIWPGRAGTDSAVDEAKLLRRDLVLPGIP